MDDRIFLVIILISTLMACGPSQIKGGVEDAGGADSAVNEAVDGAVVQDGEPNGEPQWPGLPDRDNDGVPDVVEEAAGTSPDDPADNPGSQGDFVFIVPFEDAPFPDKDTLVFEPSIRKADIFFVIDTSWSMGGVINGVRDNLRTNIIPRLDQVIEDAHFGVGQFDRRPSLGPSTNGNCVGIASEQSSTGDATAVWEAFDRLTPDCGTDEPYAQALWLWATGDTSLWPLLQPPSCSELAVGFGCARFGSVPIVVLIGDEHFCESYRTETWGPTVQEIINVYQDIAGRVLTFGRTVTFSREEPIRGADACNGYDWTPDVYERIAIGTGAVDATGIPLVFEDATGETVADDIVDGIARLASGGSFRLSAVARDLDPADGVDVTGFVDRIEPNTVGGFADPQDSTLVCVGGLSVEDLSGDGAPDHFMEVPGGTPVCFDIYPARNTFVVPTPTPQVFEVQLDVLGDDTAVFDTRTIYFVVPPGASVE